MRGEAVKKYPNIQDGERVIPHMKGYRMACCDCGLVHRLDFEVFEITGRSATGAFITRGMSDDEAQVAFRAYRDERSTGQVRRHRKPKL